MQVLARSLEDQSKSDCLPRGLAESKSDALNIMVFICYNIPSTSFNCIPFYVF